MREKKKRKGDVFITDLQDSCKGGNAILTRMLLKFLNAKSKIHLLS